MNQKLYQKIENDRNLKQKITKNSNKAIFMKIFIG